MKKNAGLGSLALVLAALSCVTPGMAFALDEAVPATELVGLWKAKNHLGPQVRGPLTLELRDEKWSAEIAGFSVAAEVSDDEIRFELPGARGGFVGRFDRAGGTVSGHWIQPPPVQIARSVASPVHFDRAGTKRWRGEVVPRESEYTFFLAIREREDGTAGVFLRNPDRNFGVIRNLDRVVRRGTDLEFIGTFFRGKDEEVQLRGVHDPDNDRFSVFFGPGRGGTHDFVRVDDDEASEFYARGKNPGAWTYRPPREESDGWPTASLEDVGISMEPIRQMIEEEIYPPAEHVGAHYVHGLLIARHGRLVLEEYFHGFHRGVPHDTRSASKSLTSLLAGAAVQAGELAGASVPVYSTIYGEKMPENLDPRKSRMTLEHLLTMSSGYHCDDGDYESPGNEDVMQQQTEELDWYRYTLALPMVREPGEEAIYCSANANLVGKVLTAATGRTLLELLETLIAEPLGIQRYYLNFQPTGEPYLGGGSHWLPRDFLKIGQVLLDGGTWNGKRIVSEEWIRRSISPIHDLRRWTYGYLWWGVDYPYKDRTVKAVFASGNGGQFVIAIPELDLLVAFYGGNYADLVLYRSQMVLVPEYILKAVDPE